jgi:hypothetical protein
MSVKSQLNSTRDFLMVGLRTTARASTPNAEAEKVLQACLDMVETLAHRPADIDVTEVEMTLSVMQRAVTELDDDTAATRAVVSSMQNAIGRLQGVRAELSAG